MGKGRGLRREGEEAQKEEDLKEDRERGRRKMLEEQGNGRKEERKLRRWGGRREVEGLRALKGRN